MELQEPTIEGAVQELLRPLNASDNPKLPMEQCRNNNIQAIPREYPHSHLFCWSTRNEFTFVSSANLQEKQYHKIASTTTTLSNSAPRGIYFGKYLAASPS